MLREMLHRVIAEAETCELLGIRIEHHLVLTFGNQHTVVGEGFLAIPVEDEQQVAT